VGCTSPDMKTDRQILTHSLPCICTPHMLRLFGLLSNGFEHSGWLAMGLPSLLSPHHICVHLSIAQLTSRVQKQAHAHIGTSIHTYTTGSSVGRAVWPFRRRRKAPVSDVTPVKGGGWKVAPLRPRPINMYSVPTLCSRPRLRWAPPRPGHDTY
jgi:hypothetical protein